MIGPFIGAMVTNALNFKILWPCLMDLRILDRIGPVFLKKEVIVLHILTTSHTDFYERQSFSRQTFFSILPLAQTKGHSCL